MTEVKMLKLEQKFDGTKDLYDYIIKNANFIGEAIGIQIQKPLKDLPFCIIGREKITEKNILFYASKGEFIENLGEIILLASQFDVYIIVIFIEKLQISYIDSIKWLNKISSDDYEFIIYQADF